MELSQAILPVAGLGTRFLPWTKAVPKELLPIGNEPIIAHLVDECLSVGIKDICFVISKGKEAIPQYFYQDPALEEELKKRDKLHHLERLQQYDEVDFHVVYQDEQHGDGHAIHQAHDWVESTHVAILFGDDLFHGAGSGLEQLKTAYEESASEEDGAVVALEYVEKEDVSKYGIIDPEEGEGRLKKVRGLVEKPAPEDAPSQLGIVGRYLIPKSTFDVLADMDANHAEELRLIDALTQQLETMPIYGYECEGTRLDTGTPEGYRHAVQVIG